MTLLSANFAVVQPSCQSHYLRLAKFQSQNLQHITFTAGCPAQASSQRNIFCTFKKSIPHHQQLDLQQTISFPTDTQAGITYVPTANYLPRPPSTIIIAATYPAVQYIQQMHNSNNYVVIPHGNVPVKKPTQSLQTAELSGHFQEVNILQGRTALYTSAQLTTRAECDLLSVLII